MLLFMRIVVAWVATALTIFGLSRLLPGFSVDSFTTAFIVAVVLGFANVLIRPILFILTLPITLVSFCLFSLVLNAGMLSLVAVVVPGFMVGGFLSALIASMVISAVGYVVDALIE